MSERQLSSVMRYIRRVASATPVSGLSDAELLKSYCSKGDAQAFSALICRHGELVGSICRRVLQHHHDAEDAFQATFLVLASKAGSIRKVVSLASWLHGVAYRIAMNAKRARGRHSGEVLETTGRPQDTPATAVALREAQIIVHEELNHLPERYRAPFVLCCLEGKSRTEAAQEMGWRIGTVSSRIAQARMLLQERLTRRGIMLSVAMCMLDLTHASAGAIDPALAARTAEAAVAFTAGKGADSASGPAIILARRFIIAMSTAAKLKLATSLVLMTGLITASGLIARQGLSPVAAAPGSQDGEQRSTGKMPTEKEIPIAAKAKVKGRVILETDGRPVAGAIVHLADKDNGTIPWRVLLTKANDQGEFAYDAVAFDKYEIWAVSENLISLSRRGYGTSISVSKEGLAPVLLKMHPGIKLRVKVVSQVTGKPIPQARVRHVYEVTESERDHLTDAHGEVELMALSPPTFPTCHLEVEAKDFARQLRLINLENREPAPFEFKLAPDGLVPGRVIQEDGSLNSGNERNAQAEVKVEQHERRGSGSVRGSVKDKQGKPVAGAFVMTTSSDYSTMFRETRTDAKGRFLIEEVSADGPSYRLVVQAAGFAPERMTFTPGTKQEPAEVAVELGLGHSLKARVVDEAGKPVAGVWVYSHAEDFIKSKNRASYAKQTDARGRFQFDSLPASSAFDFRKDGYSDIETAELPLDGTDEVVVKMLPEGVIKYKVLDSASGKPVPRFNVRIAVSPDRKPNEPTSSISYEKTDPGEEFASSEGNFEIRSLVAGSPLDVTVQADGYRPLAIQRVTPQPAPKADTIQLRLSKEP